MSYFIKISKLQKGIQGVYKINYPNGKIYIGISNDIKRRMSEHNNVKRLDSHPNQPCDLAIKKYGKIEEIEILEEVQDYQVLLEREKYWIKFYDATNKNIGYNISSGGYSSGESSPLSVFSNEEVLDIRKRRFQGERKIEVYRNFYKNKNFSTFEKIWLGNRYPQIGKEYMIPTNSISRQTYSSIANQGSRNGQAKLNEEKVKEIRKLFDSGMSITEVHKKFNEVSRRTIDNVCKRRTWKHID